MLAFSPSVSPRPRLRKRDVLLRLLGRQSGDSPRRMTGRDVLFASSPRSDATSSATSSARSSLCSTRSASSGDSARALHCLFHSWDVDGDFELPTEAIRRKLARNNHALTGVVQRVLDLADADYSGRLTEEEFVEDMLAELARA